MNLYRNYCSRPKPRKEMKVDVVSWYCFSNWGWVAITKHQQTCQGFYSVIHILPKISHIRILGINYNNFWSTIISMQIPLNISLERFYPLSENCEHNNLVTHVFKLSPSHFIFSVCNLLATISGVFFLTIAMLEVISTVPVLKGQILVNVCRQNV